MPMNQITLSQANHFVLRKQHLIDESRSEDVVQIVRDVGGLHATSSKTPYLSLFSRMRKFSREILDEELYKKRNLGKIRYIRKTVFILPKETISAAFVATRSLVEPTSEQYSKFLGISEKQYETISKRIMKILEGRGMTTKECKKELGTALNISPIVNLMCDKGLLIRGEPQGGWKSNIHTYYLFREYFPDVDLKAIDEGEARRLVVEQYLASFGPATGNDVAWWTGFPKGQIRQIITGLQDKVSSIRIPGTEAEYLVLSSDRSSLIHMKTPKNPVINMLPGLDPYLMGYKDRERYLSSKYYNYVFDRSGNTTSTILVNGEVIGIWDFADKHEPLIKLFLFEGVKESLLKDIHFAAKKIGEFIAYREVQTKECDCMVPLTQRTAGSVMSPLRDC
jgi:hypothetical protein